MHSFSATTAKTSPFSQSELLNSWGMNNQIKVFDLHAQFPKNPKNNMQKQFH